MHREKYRIEKDLISTLKTAKLTQGFFYENPSIREEGRRQGSVIGTGDYHKKTNKKKRKITRYTEKQVLRLIRPDF